MGHSMPSMQLQPFMVLTSVFYVQLILALMFEKYSNYFVKSSAAHFNFDVKKESSKHLNSNYLDLSVCNAA